MKLRVGLIGLGDAWESRHRPALRAMGDRFEVRAVCEEVAHRAEEAARQFGVLPVDGFRSLTAREDIDAVLMLSPQWFGSLPILAACEAGKAVYCAAALDIRPEEARHVKERIEQSGVAFMAEFPHRLSPATLRLKELIATGLGRPKLLFCHHRLVVGKAGGEYRPHGPRPATRALLKLVDWCRYVVGREPSSVTAVRHRGPEGAFAVDYQMMSLDFSDTDHPNEGPMAQISCGRYMPASWHEAIAFRPPAAMQICCQRGIAFVDLPTTLVWFDEAGRHLESLESERPVGEQLLGQFFRAVTSLVRNTSSLEDAYRAVAIVRAAEAGAEQGRRVKIEY